MMCFAPLSGSAWSSSMGDGAGGKKSKFYIDPFSEFIQGIKASPAASAPTAEEASQEMGILAHQTGGDSGGYGCLESTAQARLWGV